MSGSKTTGHNLQNRTEHGTNREKQERAMVVVVVLPDLLVNMMEQKTLDEQGSTGGDNDRQPDKQLQRSGPRSPHM